MSTNGGQRTAVRDCCEAVKTEARPQDGMSVFKMMHRVGCLKNGGKKKEGWASAYVKTSSPCHGRGELKESTNWLRAGDWPITNHARDGGRTEWMRRTAGV